MAKLDARRFREPLYTIAEAARIVDVPASTLAAWAHGYERRFADRPHVSGAPIISCLAPASTREPSIPFIGLAEALVLAAFRRSGVAMQRIRPAIDVLRDDLGVDHALASRRLYTDGAEVLFDYGDRHRKTDEGTSALELVVVRSGQRVFVEAIAAYLNRIEYGRDGYAALIHVPSYERAAVVADPNRAFGSPIFERGGARVDDVLERFWAGDSLEDLQREFGVPVDQLEDVLRAPHPAGLPDLFVDRSLGRIAVPERLRTAGLRLVTLAEHYGIPADEAVQDEEWLKLAGARGWVVLMKDTRIRYRTAERAALIRHKVRCFSLSSQKLGGAEMANRFIDNLDAMTRACVEDAGPFIYAVHRTRIERLAISPA